MSTTLPPAHREAGDALVKPGQFIAVLGTLLMTVATAVAWFVGPAWLTVVLAAGACCGAAGVLATGSSGGRSSGLSRTWALSVRAAVAVPLLFWSLARRRPNR
ncbi:hypothetical protein [Streptomyces sp. NPDC058629]|uniref:hypothetical protein n=1 Tax=Streptomyces sp. NPDC058629 TaxID=3346565 RepID=UPI00365B7741